MFERFIGKKVKLRLKNNFFFEGIVEEVTDDKLLLKDRFKGDMILDIVSIAFIAHSKEDE